MLTKHPECNWEPTVKPLTVHCCLLWEPDVQLLGTWELAPAQRYAGRMRVHRQQGRAWCLQPMIRCQLIEQVRGSPLLLLPTLVPASNSVAVTSCVGDTVSATSLPSRPCAQY